MAASVSLVVDDERLRRRKRQIAEDIVPVTRRPPLRRMTVPTLALRSPVVLDCYDKAPFRFNGTIK